MNGKGREEVAFPDLHMYEVGKLDGRRGSAL
jgi:hypothetical protein